jgi:hypothetical protein
VHASVTMPWPSDPPTHPRPANLRSTGEESLLGCWRGGRGLRVNGAAGGPGCCSRTGRDAPQIDPRQRSLRTESLTAYRSCWSSAASTPSAGPDLIAPALALALDYYCVPRYVRCAGEGSLAVVPSQRSGST